MLERIKVFLCLELPQTRKAIILVKLNAGVGSGHCFWEGRGGGVDLNFERELKISKKIAERMWQKYRSNGKNQGDLLFRVSLAVKIRESLSTCFSSCWPCFACGEFGHRASCTPLHYYQVLPSSRVCKMSCSE